MSLLKIQQTVNITPYEFDRQIVENHGADLFYKDRNGRIGALNKEVYRIAARELLKEIGGKKKQ